MSDLPGFVEIGGGPFVAGVITDGQFGVVDRHDAGVGTVAVSLEVRQFGEALVQVSSQSRQVSVAPLGSLTMSRPAR